jgi:hypothetical protein
MKADVVLVVKVDVSQASAVIERMQQVLAAEFGVPAPEPKRSARGLGPEIGSEWRFGDPHPVRSMGDARFRVVDRLPDDGPFTIRMQRIDEFGGGDWLGSVAKHNNLFTEATG